MAAEQEELCLRHHWLEEKVCQNVRTLLRWNWSFTKLLVSKHDAGKVDDCGANDPFSSKLGILPLLYVYQFDHKRGCFSGLKLNEHPFVFWVGLYHYSNPAF